MSSNLEFKDLPWKVRESISREHVSVCESNQADYRPTSQSTLNEITARRVQQYEAYLEFNKTLSPEDDMRTLALFRLEWHGWGLQDDYLTVKIAGVWYFAPRYMLWYDRMVKLRAVLA